MSTSTNVGYKYKAPIYTVQKISGLNMTLNSVSTQSHANVPTPILLITKDQCSLS